MISIHSKLSSLATLLWLYLGRWLERKSLQQLAATCYKHGMDGDGRTAADAGFRLAKLRLGQDKNREAAEACRKALAHDPNHARAWCALGASLRRLAEIDAARDAYENALRLNPNYAQAWSNLGEWQLLAGAPKAALASLDRALQIKPNLLEALNNRIAALYELGRLDAAELAARHAIDSFPKAAALHVNLANVLLHSGRARLAVKTFYRALECDPACAEAHMNLATLFGETHHLGATLTFIETEIAAKGESVQRLVSLALAQQAQGNHAAAEITCNKVLEIQPSNISALVTLSGCLSHRADHRGAIELQQKALAINPQMPAICSNIAFNSTYLPNISTQEVFNYHRDWSLRFGSPPEQSSHAFSYPQDKKIDRPLRIGYVSGDFGRHPVGFLLSDIIRHHDREQFHIYCYSMMRNDGDELTAAMRTQAFAWRDALLSSDEELAQTINADRIDILIDLSGHTAYNRLPTFVRKPAPIQATWIGYFHSTGLDAIDYFITDPYTSPRGCGQLFSETPAYLPHSRFCYAAPDYTPEVSPPPCLNQDRITFGCFNRIEKLVDPVIAAWAEILRACPRDRLVLKAGSLQDERMRTHLLERFEKFGVSTAQIDLRAPSSHPEMLKEYSEIDIALDPFPFNGGMTTLEALWMGVPVVTICGDSVVSRQTISALANIGLDDVLAFADVESYIAGAIALSRDTRTIERLRNELRPRMAASPLCQAETFARDLEALYRHMWQAWCGGGKLPSDI